MTRPALLAISHGTASPAGQAAVAGLVAAVAKRLPDVTVRLGHVDVQQPDVAASLDALPTEQPVVIVPLLLSAGYHVRVDLREQSAGARAASPSRRRSGPTPGSSTRCSPASNRSSPTADDTVVLAVAGSSDDRANEDCRTIGAMLAERLGREVTVGFLAAAEPRLGAAVSHARAAARAAASGRVIVANYLLAPGYFHDLAVRLADGSPVARPLLDDDEPAASLVELVVDRYRAAHPRRERRGLLDRVRQLGRPQLCDVPLREVTALDDRIGRGARPLILSRSGLATVRPGMPGAPPEDHVTISDTDSPRAAAPRPEGARARPPRPSSRPNGQWKIDGTAPLNGNEEWKQVDDGLSVRDRIESTYAQGGFASIDPTDLHGRFRVWGLYTQRKPGIDGGRTATLTPEELEDEYFMLRVRIDGGQLTTEQLRVIAGISTEFGRDTADLTDRQNIQLHWIRVEDVPEIWRRLEAVGLQTTEACGDVPRVVLGSPVAGIAADELIDPTPQIDEITSTFIGDASLANLPRKFKSAITGHPSQDVVHEINDVAFVAVAASRTRHRLRPVGRRRPLDGPRPRASVWASFVTPERVADAWHGVAQIFRDYGYRRLRNKARLKFLLAEWGAEKFRQVLQDEYLGYALPDGPAAPKPLTAGDHVGIHRQKDGRFYVGATPIVGRVSGPNLAKLADLIEAHGSTRLRTTPHQKVVILDIPEDRVESLVAGLDELGLQARPSLIRRGTIACTGIEFCKLAIVETKAYATAAVLDLEAASRPVRAAASDLSARQRLPQLVRAHPDRRHRAQGSAGHDRRRAGSRLPGAPRRRPRLAGSRRGRPRAHRPRPEGRGRRHRRLRRAGRHALPSGPGCRIRRDLRPMGAPRRRGGPPVTPTSSPPLTARLHRSAETAGVARGLGAPVAVSPEWRRRA